LVEFLIAISKEEPRYGWRRAAKATRRRGWALNDKRVKGLWKVHGEDPPIYGSTFIVSGDPIALSWRS
jgi:hypothetical protein